MLQGGFLDDDEDFNREFESVTTVEENVEGRKVYVCGIYGKECVSSGGLKRHETLKHTREGTAKTSEKLKKAISATLQISQLEKIVKECAKLCHGDLCLNLTGKMQLIHGKFWNQLLQNFIKMQIQFFQIQSYSKFKFSKNKNSEYIDSYST